MAALEDSWFKLLWECNDILVDFHYLPEKPNLTQQEESLLNIFYGIIEDFIFDDSSDHICKVISELGKFSKNHLTDYVTKYKALSPTGEKNYNCQWTICHLFLGQLKVLKQNHSDLVKSLCIKSFESDEVLDQFRLIPPQATNPKNLFLDRTGIEYYEKVKTLKLLRKVFRKFENSPKEEKEFILKNGLELSTKIKNIRRLEKIIDKIQERIKSPVILIEKDGPYKRVFGYKEKITPQKQNNFVKQRTKKNSSKSKISQKGNVESNKPFKNFKNSTLISIIAHAILIICLAIFIVDKINKETETNEINITVVDDKEELISEVLTIEEPELQAPEDNFKLTPSIAVLPQEKNDSKAETLEDDVPELNNNPGADAPSFNITKITFDNTLHFKGHLSGRSPKNQIALVKKYGGTPKGQEALLRGLRWLKKNQAPNGAWLNQGITGLAVLAFLAHGVTGEHEEFGKTVTKALQWLIERERQLAEGQQIQGSGYEHPIITFALCEAVSLMPESYEFKEAAERLLDTLLNGQTDSGGFPYKYRSYSELPLSPQLTLTGWNFLAIKAAMSAGIENKRLLEASKRLIKYFGSVYIINKGFSYRDKTTFTHRAIGCLGIQLMGDHNDSPSYKDIIQVTIKKDISRKSMRCFYGAYYLTLMLFNHGGDSWQQWAKIFEPVLIQTQRTHGSWKESKEWFAQGPVMDTALACLMLTVYYRYTPIHEQKMPEEELNLIIE